MVERIEKAPLLERKAPLLTQSVIQVEIIMTHAIATHNRTKYLNALTGTSRKPVAFGATLRHLRTEEEIHIDILVDDDSFITVTHGIRLYYPLQWEIYERWEIKDDFGVANQSFAECGSLQKVA